MSLTLVRRRIDAGDNNYQITVSATEISGALPAKRTDIALTVIVGNADDTGELTLEWLQPEVGVEIGATLTDPDTETDPVGEITDEAWTWYISKATEPVIGEDSHWNVIAGQIDDSYIPVAANEGRYLWVHVEYTDPQSATTKEADAKSTNPVRAAVSLARTPPPTSRMSRTPGLCPRARPWATLWATRLRPLMRTMRTTTD